MDLIFTQPLRFILACHGLFFLHASVICKGKDCILISGPQDSGKSTLAVTLERNGFDLLTDDKCFIKLVRNQIHLLPFPTKIGLNDGVLKIYPELIKYTLKNYRYGRKRRLSLNHLSHSKCLKSYRGKMIIFPKYKAGRNVYMKEIPREEALHRLAKEVQNVYSKKESQYIFWALYNLIRKTNSFELIYNDDRLNEIPKIVQRIFKPCLN